MAEGNTLDKLRVSADELASRIGCQPAAALAYVLTGYIPLVAPVTYTLSWGTQGPSVTVKAHFPWVPAEVVRYMYVVALKDARDRWKMIKKKRARSSPIAARVKLFLAEHEDENWWEVLKLWNQQNPQHRYSNPRYLYRMKI